MRCLWLTWLDPDPQHDGQRIYSGRLIRATADAGFDVDVLCAANDQSARQDGEREGRITWRLVRHAFPAAWKSIASSLPHIAHRSAVPDMQRRLADMLADRRWDCIVFDGLNSGWALDPVRRMLATTGRSSRLVYLSHNHEESLRRQIAAGADGNLLRLALLRRDARKAGRLERRLVEAADLVTAITPEDAAQFETRARNPVLVLPPGYQGRRLAERRITTDVPRRAILVGSFEWIAKQINLRDFLAAADPVFAAAGAELEIVGNGDPRFFAELRAGLQATRLVGRVESITPHLDAARMAVVPERLGGGFKLKVLDYVFNRLPIAALDGSVAGTPLTSDSMLTFSDHRPLANGVLAALDDLELLNRLQSCAYKACAERFNWSDRGERLAATIGAL